MNQDIEKIIYDTLSPVFKISPSVAPQGTVAPFMVYSLFENDSDTLCGQTGGTAISVQLDSYALNAAEAKAAAKQAFGLLESLGPSDVQRTPGYEDDTKLYRYQIEFNLIM